jgi:hypothetical protein
MLAPIPPSAVFSVLAAPVSNKSRLFGAINVFN